MEEDERTGKFRKSMKPEIKPSVSYSELQINAIKIKKQDEERE